MNEDLYYDMFQLPLSIVAHEQSIQLKECLEGMMNMTDFDKWLFPWKDARYITKNVYLALLNPPKAPAPFS
jgi:hypothetical protein